MMKYRFTGLLIYLLMCNVKAQPQTGQFPEIPEMRATIELLEIENKKLEKDIELAQRIIEQQNSQLEQANDWIAITLGGLAVFIGIVAFVIVFQFLAPARTLLEKARKTNKKSRKMLSSIKVELESKVKRHFEEVNAERFKKALDTLDSRIEWTQFGSPVLSEFLHLGLNDGQTADLLALVKEKIPYMGGTEDMNNPPADIYSVARIVFDALGKQRNLKLEEFLLEYYSSTPYGNKVGRHQMQHQTMKYLAKYLTPDLYPIFLGIVNNIHPDQEVGVPPASYLIDNLLWQLKKVNPTAFAKVINDEAFVNALVDNKAILHFVVQRTPFVTAESKPDHYFNEEVIKDSKFMHAVKKMYDLKHVLVGKLQEEE